MGVYIKGIEMPTSCYDCRFREVYSYKDGEKRVCELNWEVLFGDEWGKNFKHPDCPLVEVPKQKHGKWFFISKYCVFSCNQCNGHSPRNSDYCPNCGARMDGDSDV